MSIVLEILYAIAAVATIGSFLHDLVPAVAAGVQVGVGAVAGRDPARKLR